MLSYSTARTVEAAQIVMLVMFVAWMPFCFKSMDAVDTETWQAAEVDVGIDQRCGLEKAQPALDAKGDTESTSASPQQGTTEEAGDDGKSRCPPALNRLSLLPFLVALIGGGVFSLEAFEAFPML